MPPHARMSLVQQLLLRSLVARFWREPYAPRRLVRWGTAASRPVPAAAFRARRTSRMCSRSRRAPASSCAPSGSRRISSSDFRSSATSSSALRVARAAAGARALACHGRGRNRRRHGALRRLLGGAAGGEGRRASRPIAMSSPATAAPCRCRPTGRAGEFVAGVRYRAWQPWSALHPNIGVHSPLTFDIVDTWMKRSEGGCRYHVVHPGGRSHDTFPVNAFEAESRRLARFFRLDHTPGPMSVEPADARR